jgi:hypothetical protein
MKGLRKFIVTMFVSGAMIAGFVLPAIADGGGGP